MARKRYKLEPSFQFMSRIPEVRESTNQAIRTPEDVYALMSDFVTSAQEGFFVIHLNSRNYMIERQMVTLGVADTCLVNPRVIFRSAVTMDSTCIVLAHNHPSGDPSPSAEDIRITRQLVQAGQVLGIKVMDHVVCGRTSPDRAKPWCSMRELGLLQFDT
jgi:DNA repair protein RadC